MFFCKYLNFIFYKIEQNMFINKGYVLPLSVFSVIVFYERTITNENYNN